MPLGRFQIRNEYSFADPDLYKAADKDDPEALLEGVAMAGFVGVLRQLGDLAQFAAEIFHDLHEEVMATAARGHGLIVRVQQLEAEFPLLERTLLSKTCHTAFLYNSGIDCHPNARMDENVIAQGDLPRFIMDSYEECRGPPRLFLLDKFDVAGAGACLKRFSDPSFFRMEATSSSSKRSDGQREKKTRRVKKRGTCWRNGDTPETFPSTHAKLHQLFLEELIETGGNDPDRRVKLKKRQFTGSLFDQDKRRSYMDKFLDSCSPEQKIVHEVCIDALPLTWISDNACESGLEIVAIGSDSPVKQSFSASPDTREVVLEPAFEGISEGKLNDMIYGRAAQDSRLNHDSDDGKVSSTISKVKSEEACAVAESKSELSDGDGNYSDNFASDIDDYMDALATMESDVETDSECKKHPRYSNLKPIVVDSDASEGPRDPHGLFLDSQSLGNSTASEDGNNFFRERQCSSRSISVNSTAETSTYLDAAVVAVPSVSVSTSDADNVYLAQHSVSEDMPKSKIEESSIVAVEADDTSNTVAVEADDDDMSHTVPEFGDASDTSYFTNSNTILNSADMEATLRESSLTSPGVDEVGSNSAEPDILSGMSDLQHTNQTISSGHMSSAQQPLHDDGIVFDAPERTDSGHWSSAKQPMHDDTIVFYVPETMESGHWSSAQKPMRDVESHSSSVYSESFPDPENTHDGVLQIEPKKSDLVSSLDQQHSDDFGVANVSSTCDPIVPVMVNPVNDAPDLDSCISSTEENSYDQYSASNSMQKVINQEESEMTNHSLTYPPDNEAACLSCSSQSDSSVKEVFNNVESEEKASSALIVAQTEDLPLLISSGLETCDSEPIFSGTTDAADENGSFEAAVAGAVSSGDEPDSGLTSGSADGHSSVIDPLETTDHPHKLPSEISDAALFKRGRAQNDEHYPGNETAEQQNSVSSGWDEYEGAPNVNMFDGDAVCSSVTSVYLNQPDLVETIENLEKDEPIAVQFDATSALDCNDATSALDCNSKNNDENESFSHENLPFEESSMVVTGSSSILAAQSDSDQCHTMGRLEHEETGTNGSKQVDIEGYPNENTLLATPVSVSGEEQEQPVSVTKNYHDNEEELVVCPSAKLVAEEHVDLVENASADIQSSENFDAVEAPLTSEDGNEHLDSSSNQGHLLERTEENVGSLTDDNSKTKIPLEKELDLRDDESKLKTLLTNRQMQTPDSLSKEENLDSLYDDGQPLMPGLPAQPAVNLLGSFSQPMVELSSFLHDNSMLNDSNQATQMVESLGQPIQTSGFPVHGMLPPEPQINLDSPPLPPLPPMQWRLSRLQNPSAPTERQMFHHTQGSVQPMTLPTNGGETNTSTYTVNSAEQPVSSNVLAQEVLAQPLAAPASEVYVENNRIEIQREDLSLTTQTSINSQNEIQREDLSLTTQTSVSSQNGTSVSEECNQPIPNHAEPQSLAEGRVSPTDSPVEATVHADNSAQSDRLKHIPLVTDQAAVNSHVHFLSSAPMHYDWQLHPGLIAPEARVAWPTAFDGMPTDTGVYANGALQKKAPRPRNPLIDEVVAIDKSKLRKVERVKPSVEQKPDEGESFLEQLRLRKVERVKPPAESKAQEGESLLENLQLRKVKERIKPSVDSKNEEREFSLQQLQLRKVGESTKPQAELKTEERESPLAHIQLRKVRERVKSEAEQKAEEKESLQVPLRKVSDRVKPEVEQKPEETESPRVQLRKVDERVKPEIQHKPEDPESPRVQPRKVSDKAKLVVQQQPEETESPRVQLRKVGQATLTPAAPKIERRDSILEQIRNKSFSLRPAIAARPNIQGPRTNLKVAAILEKASNIRQAMAGSDEEDDGDTWSEC